jgi:hypothetical protein
MRATSVAAVLASVATSVGVGLALRSGSGDGSPRGRAAGAPPAKLDEAPFWKLIAKTRGAARNDTARQSDLLDARLRRLSPQARTEFARISRRLDRRAYTWSLWGAAYMIEDGCSDDCFREFRSYLISLGRGPYEQALSDPDSLASVAEDRDTGAWEDVDLSPGDASDLSGDPRGTPFDENDQAGLDRRYPRLAARFRH